MHGMGAPTSVPSHGRARAHRKLSWRGSHWPRSGRPIPYMKPPREWPEQRGRWHGRSGARAGQVASGDELHSGHESARGADSRKDGAGRCGERPPASTASEPARVHSNASPQSLASRPICAAHKVPQSGEVTSCGTEAREGAASVPSRFPKGVAVAPQGARAVRCRAPQIWAGWGSPCASPPRRKDAHLRGSTACGAQGSVQRSEMRPRWATR